MVMTVKCQQIKHVTSLHDNQPEESFLPLNVSLFQITKNVMIMFNEAILCYECGTRR